MYAVLIIVGVSRAFDRNVIFREVRPQTVEKMVVKTQVFLEGNNARVMWPVCTEP